MASRLSPIPIRYRTEEAGYFLPLQIFFLITIIRLDFTGELKILEMELWINEASRQAQH